MTPNVVDMIKQRLAVAEGKMPELEQVIRILQRADQPTAELENQLHNIRVTIDKYKLALEEEGLA